jgi:hypothetical protein
MSAPYPAPIGLLAIAEDALRAPANASWQTRRTCRMGEVQLGAVTYPELLERVLIVFFEDEPLRQKYLGVRWLLGNRVPDRLERHRDPPIHLGFGVFARRGDW